MTSSELIDLLSNLGYIATTDEGTGAVQLSAKDLPDLGFLPAWADELTTQDLPRKLLSPHCIVNADGHLEHMISHAGIDHFFAGQCLDEGVSITFVSQNSPASLVISKATRAYCVYDALRFGHFAAGLRDTGKSYVAFPQFGYSTTIRFRSDQQQYFEDDASIEPCFDDMRRALFQTALATGTALELGGQRRVSEEYQPISKSLTLSYPSQRLETDAISYYLAARSAQYASIRYLNLYQVIESCFRKVSWERAREDVRKWLIAPVDHHEPAEINRLIEVAAKDVKGREEDLLVATVTRLVAKSQLSTFARKSDYLKKRREVLGMALDGVSTDPESVQASAARRVYRIRNAIVHSKSDAGGEGRYVPSPSCERALIAELPLVQYLAEQAVTNSAALD